MGQQKTAGRGEDGQKAVACGQNDSVEYTSARETP